MSRKTARNKDHAPDPKRKARCAENADRRTNRGFANRHEERGHQKEAARAKVRS